MMARGGTPEMKRGVGQTGNQAMFLEQLDRVKYQPRIRQCAQFLVDNQCPAGNWGYGEPTTYVEIKDLATGGKVPSKPKVQETGSGQKPKVVRRIPVTKQRDAKPGGDHSNTQYAALGLRACQDAGIDLPKSVVELAKKWWGTQQLPDKDKDNGSGDARGWTYSGVNAAYGSMTAGAVGALCIYDFILGLDWKKDQAVQAGMGWLAKHFSVTENPEMSGRDMNSQSFLYYYLYALERVGMLYVTQTIGKHDWYLEGTKAILDAQKPDGSWLVSEYWRSPDRPGWDTCFAILFLKRATRPLLDVPSVDRYVAPDRKQ